MHLLMSAAACGSMDAAAAGRELRVGVYQNEPKVFQRSDGEAAGILVDVLERIAEDEGWVLSYVPCEWQACLVALADGRIDLMPDVAHSPEREKRFSFHKVPALNSWSQVYAHPGVRIASMLDLDGKRLAVLDGSIQASHLAQQAADYGLALSFVGVRTPEATFQAVVAGQADAAVVSYHFGRAKASQYEVVETALVLLPVQLFYASGIGRHADVLASIDHHLGAWRAQPDSPYFQIVDHWRTPDPPSRLQLLAPPTAALLLLLLGGAAVAMLVLRRRLASKASEVATAEGQRAAAVIEREETEQQFRATFEQAAVGIAMVAPDGRWLRVNDRLCQIVGYSRDELLGLGFQDITHPEDLATDLDQVRRMLAGEISTYTIEKRYRRKDGSPVWANLTVGLARHADGRPNFFVSVVEDIRARKQAETALAESEARLKMFIEHAPAALAMFDREMRYLAASRRWRQEYGLGERELLGHSHYEIFPEIPEHWKALHRRALAGEVLSSDQDGFKRLDGTTQWLRWELRPWRRQDGGVGGIVCFSEDITERRTVDEELARYRQGLEAQVAARTDELQRARQAAEAASAAKGDFLAKMSHEIRTPLNAIVGMVSLIRHDGSAARLDERLGIIETSSQHLLNIISEILDLSKIDADKLTLEESELRPDALMEEVAAMLHAVAAAKSLALVVEPLPPMPTGLVGDPMRVRQCLLNLASNAIKFTDQGTVTLRVRVDAVSDSHATLRFEVADTGIGIPQDTLQRLFAPFEQADNSTTRRYGGTGLGLAITMRLAGLMGGSAGADSRPGQGSTFWFTARLSKGQAEHMPAAPALPGAPASLEAELRKEHGGRHILLVEDNELNRLVAMEMLRRPGLLEVDVAQDGIEAVELFDEQRHALVLMDVHMPRMDGLEATRCIRARPGAAHVPILAMTANALAEDAAECLAAGMDDFIVKPYSLEQMYGKLLEWLRRSPRAD